MKNLSIILSIISFYSCSAQKLMQNINESNNLKINEAQFVKKPLKFLLKEIEPEIKWATATPHVSNNEGPGYIRFRFSDYMMPNKSSNPVTITVYV